VSTGVLRLRVRVRGRVQGVWFRESTRREAERLGVRGWVRNCPDGSVEAVLEGPHAIVRELETWLHHGPSGARVVDVQSAEEPAAGETDFRVAR
jgi:acylphosphatase